MATVLAAKILYKCCLELEVFRCWLC